MGLWVFTELCLSNNSWFDQKSNKRKQIFNKILSGVLSDLKSELHKKRKNNFKTFETKFKNV